MQVIPGVPTRPTNFLCSQRLLPFAARPPHKHELRNFQTCSARSTLPICMSQMPSTRWSMSGRSSASHAHSYRLLHSTDEGLPSTTQQFCKFAHRQCSRIPSRQRAISSATAKFHHFPTHFDIVRCLSCERFIELRAHLLSHYMNHIISKSEVEYLPRNG